MELNVDRQGRIVLPRAVRKRFGLDGRAGRVQLVQTPEGVLLSPPPARATVVRDEHGMPIIEGLEGVVRNEDVLAAIDRERSDR